MAYTKQFESKLNDLWHRRIAYVRSLVLRRQGTPKVFSKQFREKCISELQKIATRVLLRQGAKKEYHKVVSHSRRNKISPREAHDTERLLLWAEKHGATPTIYSFWRGSKCLYVGKAENFVSRFRQYVGAKSRYLGTGVTIKAHFIKRRSQLGQAECLAIHLFEPMYNKMKAAHRAWGKSCPVCKVHDQIKDELQSLFSIR